MKTIGVGLVFVAIALGSAAQGCAKAADSGGATEGAGGFGGGSTGSVAEGPGPSAGGSGGAAATSTAAGSGTTSASGTTGSTTSSASSTAASTSGVSASASTGSGMGCPAGQHLCGGVCADNTPQTGCFGSNTCLACAPAPVNGTSTCSGNGTCDFTCGASYVKQGNACVCSAACCSDADCGGNGSTCSGGACTVVPPPPSCDGSACTAGCLLTCAGQGKFGAGTCINNACICACL